MSTEYIFGGTDRNQVQWANGSTASDCLPETRQRADPQQAPETRGAQSGGYVYGGIDRTQVVWALRRSTDHNDH